MSERGTWKTRERRNDILMGIGVGMIVSSIVGWFYGLSDGMGTTLLMAGTTLAGGTHANNTWAKVSSDKKP